jgi:hypothetical protein
MTVEISSTQGEMGRLRSARLAAHVREIETVTPREPGMDETVYAAMIKRLAMSRVFDEELRRSIK